MIDNLVKLLAAASFAFILLFVGVTVSVYKVFPYDYFSRGAKGGYALYTLLKHELTAAGDRPGVHSWYPLRHDKKGLVIHDKAKSSAGVTFYVDSVLQKARLLAMDGSQLYEWHRPYSQVWEPGGTITDPIGDQDVAWEFAWPFPNGDLLVIFRANYKVPYGYGMAKLDKDSNVIWRNIDSFHHELDVAPDGRIFAMSQTISERDVEGLPWIEAPMVEDFLVELDSDGKALRRFSVFDAFLNSDFATYLFSTPPSNVGDYLHVNSIEYLTETRADALPFAKAGQVLVSLRNPGIVAVVDFDEAKVVWAMQGPWKLQHDPNILDNGNLLVFDNQGHMGPGGVTRVVEFDLQQQKPVWVYSGDADQPFQSLKRGSHDRLPNGNTLITESHAGRIFEVTMEGKIVWEYHTPERWRSTEPFIPYLRYARRYPNDWFTFGLAK
jgi:hypothetical protein